MCCDGRDLPASPPAFALKHIHTVQVKQMTQTAAVHITFPFALELYCMRTETL